MSPTAFTHPQVTARAVSRTSPAAALTTPFTQPPKCSAAEKRFALPACMPPNWDAYWYGNIAYYSPAVCPQSYAVAAPRPNEDSPDQGFGPATFKGETAVMCCPSGYVTVSDHATYCSSSSALAYAIQVRWQSSDVKHLEGITQMESQLAAMPTGGYSTVSPASSPTSTSSQSSGGLSTGAKVAIGIFVPIIVLSLFAGALMYCLRRRQQRLRAESAPPNLDKDAFHSHASSTTSDTIRVNSYLTSQTALHDDDLKHGNVKALTPKMDNSFELPTMRALSPFKRQSHISLASVPDPYVAEAQAQLEANAPALMGAPYESHRPQVSLTIPADAHFPEPTVQRQQHGDTPLLPRAPSPQQYHPQVELNRAMSPPLQNYGYSRMQRQSREDLAPFPPFVAPLPPPTVDRPEPLRIKAMQGAGPTPRSVRRASSTPSLAPVHEIETEDRYMVPPTTADGDVVSRYNRNALYDQPQDNRLVAATFPMSPSTQETTNDLDYSDASPMQMPHPIMALEAHAEPYYANSAQNSLQQPPSSPPRSKSAMERRLHLTVVEPYERSRSALDQSPSSLYSSDDIPFRPTTPQALPRVFQAKRTAHPVAHRMDIEPLPKIPDYAGASYGGDDASSMVDVQDEEMFRRVTERRMLEDRERRLEREVDARHSWRGVPWGHRPKSMSFG